MQLDFADELETGSQIPRQDQEACSADSSDPPGSIVLARSCSEELENMRVEAEDQSRPASSFTPADHELVDF